MLNQSVSRLLIKLSFPAVVGMFAYSLLSLIDTFFVARLGAIALAAITLTIPVQILITSLASATGVGLTSLISRTLGQDNIKFADNVAWHGFFIGIFYGLIFLVVGNHYLDQVILLFGCDQESFTLCKGYLNIILNGCMFIFIPIIMSSILQGEGNTFLPMIVSLLGVMLNVLFDPVLIFGLGPIKGLGLNGAALATILAHVITSTLIVFLVLRKSSYLSWSITNFRPSLKALKGIYRVALPTLVMEIGSVFIMTLLNRILTSYSYTAVAVMGVFMHVRSIIYTPVHGLCQGAVPVAGFAYGAKDNDRVKETMIKASALGFFLIGWGWAIVQCYPLSIMRFFSDDPSMLIMGVSCLRLATMVLPLMGPIIILHSVLQAIGKGTTAMWLSLIRQAFFFFPLIIILPHYFGIQGVWLAFSVSEILSALLALVFFIGLWRDLQTGQRPLLLMLFNGGYNFKRLLAWLRW
ncbi:MAG: MATE family efflux transporter [Syntrophomonadaceae bacterium]|jgi:putative MATE family efflux protein